MKHLIYYKNQMIKACQSLDITNLEKIEKIIYEKIKKNKQIFTCGNGGAASVSNHFLCDFNKGIKISSNSKLKPKVISLSSDLENILAISNDISFEEIFKFQLENYYKRGDLLLTFSCSGTSKNILTVLKFAKLKGLTTISFTGFASKKYQKISDMNFNIGIKNYGISEDFFQIIMHMLSQSIRSKFISKNSKKNVIL